MPLDRAQAAELLRRYWGTVVERSLVVSAIREVEPGRGYVELERRYVVSGTADERGETVFLRFRCDDRGCVLEELVGRALMWPLARTYEVVYSSRLN